MRSEISVHQMARRATFILVAGSTLGGVLACLLGVTTWGLIGLAIGLAGAWGLFLCGMLELHRREQRLEQVAIAMRAAPTRESASASREFWSE